MGETNFLASATDLRAALKRGPSNNEGGVGFRLHATRLFTTAIILVCALGLGTGTASAGPAIPNVVLLQMDGHRLDRTLGMLNWDAGPSTPCPSARRDPIAPVFCEKSQQWTCLPTLCERFELIQSSTGPGKTLTRPQTVQMLTGLIPDTTGVYRNSGGRVPLGMSVFSDIQDGLGGAVRFGIVGSHRFVIRPFTYARRAGILSKEFFATRGRDKPLFTGSATAANTIEMLDTLDALGDPFFLVSHIKNADTAGHKVGAKASTFGVVDSIYNEAITASWHRAGEIMDHIEALGIADDTVFLAHPDHGFLDRFHHAGAGPPVTDSYFASTVPLDGAATGVSLLDVVPTILDLMGIDPTAQTPPLDGASRLAP